jgi:putative aldouronate transport system permease protein
MMGLDDWIINTVVLTVCGLITISVAYPIIFVVSASFSDPVFVLSGQVRLFPKGFTLEGYEKIFSYQPIWTGYRNTIFYASFGTLINLAVTLPAAYSLSRKDLRGRNFFTLLFAITMFFSGGLIPTYLVIKQLGMLDTVWSLLLPGAISMYNCVIVRSYFSKSIPYELSESAFIDGCSNVRLFFSIILPLSTPIIAVLALFAIVGHWNAYFSAMIYLNNYNLFPLQVQLRNILLMGQMDDLMNADPEFIRDQIRLMQLRESMKYGLIVISTLPVLCVYPFIQKYFVKGIMLGALKG